MSGEALRAQIFEQIGLQQRLFDREQLAQAKRRSRADGRTLGDQLVNDSVLGREQLRGLERAVTYRLGRDEDKEIAKIIVQSHYCPDGAVEAALKRQKEFYAQSGELIRLGALLVETANITESQRIAAHKIFSIEQLRSSAT